MVARSCAALAFVLCLSFGVESRARDWRAPEPWPEDAPRVLIIGDSNVYGPIGRAVQAGLVTDGYAVWRSGRPSSGLSRPDRFDWLAQAAQMIAEARPAVVIAQIGGNDILVVRWRGDKRRRVSFRDEPGWRAAYGERVRDFLEVLTGDGRKVFLLSPTNRGHGLAQVERVRDVQREAAGAVPGVNFIDMFELTSDERGDWLRAIEVDGKRVALRRWDKVHFNDTGGELVGERVLGRLRGAGLALP
jgi:hypothetical protein